MSCTRASKFLDANEIEPAEVVPASRKLSGADAAALAKAASLVVVAKGKTVREFKPGGKVSKEIVDAMLGPTGNLRAPTIKVGKTVLVGFNDDAYAKALR
jgi:arsenate reductase-like glutaredoxin family protein